MSEKGTLGHIENLKVKQKENLYEILHILACQLSKLQHCNALGSFAQNNFCANSHKNNFQEFEIHIFKQILFSLGFAYTVEPNWHFELFSCLNTCLICLNFA